jgi:GLPGLI family protein
MKKQIIFVACAMFAFMAKGQQLFLDKVSIDYVKTVAVWPLIKEIEPRWFEQGKDRLPKETISYFNFTGDAGRSLYKLTKEAEIPRGMWFQTFADNNVVYNDYTSGSTTSQKSIYEETYLLQDSLLKIKWKITADTRNIAGFECRKAIGILFDTVSVFAFYTDEIMINGGPEGINGLPGMILGIGIPRLHTTWFATKVKALDAVDAKSVSPATKGTKTDRSKMLSSLNSAMKNWQGWGQKVLLAFLI